MNIPGWFKLGALGAMIGAVGMAIIGFSYGGWVTASSAEKLAVERGKSAVVAAMVPICVEMSKQDPKLDETLAELAAASSYNRGNIVMKAGWATMPGTDAPNRELARACVDSLVVES